MHLILEGLPRPDSFDGTVLSIAFCVLRIRTAAPARQPLPVNSSKRPSAESKKLGKLGPLADWCDSAAAYSPEFAAAVFDHSVPEDVDWMTDPRELAKHGVNLLWMQNLLSSIFVVPLAIGSWAMACREIMEDSFPEFKAFFSAFPSAVPKIGRSFRARPGKLTRERSSGAVEGEVGLAGLAAGCDDVQLGRAVQAKPRGGCGDCGLAGILGGPGQYLEGRYVSALGIWLPLSRCASSGDL